MISPSLLSAASTLRALVAGGMEHLVVAPGSRSAPVAYAAAAAAAAGALRVHVRIDERDAGFTALGIARSTGRPTAVLTTSGTAAGELLPAVMEASHSGVPLVALTADRPPELRGTGANQTTRQPGMFHGFVRAGTDLVPDDDAATALDRTLAALGADRTGAAGPAHVNLALRDPLYPCSEEDHDFLASWARELGEFVAAGLPGPVAHPWSVTDEPLLPGRTGGHGPAATGASAEGVRAVVVAGDGAGEQAERFARRTGFPLLAEPSSNARSGSALSCGYQYLADLEVAQRIEAVVLAGRPTLNRQVAALLKRPGVRVLAVRPEPAPWFEPGRRPEETVPSFAEAARLLGPVREGWAAAWSGAALAARDRLVEAVAGTPELTGLHVADAVWQACLADGSVLVAGSSNPIRDLDLAARPGAPLAVVANRGVAGIDGTVATAHGVALGTGRPVRVLLGDLTMLHDVGGLLLGPGEEVPDVHLVVLNDGGGGIFGTLEHGELARDVGRGRPRGLAPRGRAHP